jgi:hypothetical protein
MQLDVKKFESVFFRWALGACILAVLAAVGMYVYLGSFSRYLADDYCEAVRVTSAPTILDAVLERYTTENWPRATMRYSNLFFVGMGEALGDGNMPITIVGMSALWVVGLVWSVHELRKRLGVDWLFQIDLFLGLLLGFLSFLQAPNVFQTVHWRSAMMTHFAPLVFGSLLIAFVLRQSRRAEREPISPLVYMFVLFASFIIAGFSEPPTTTLLTALPLLIATVWMWGKPPAKNRILALLISAFIGVLLGLLAMLLSPAVEGMAQEKELNIPLVLGTSFLYSYQFMLDGIRTQPLPNFIAAFLPFALTWLHRQFHTDESNIDQKRLIRIWMLALPVLVWILIAAGFAPSVYGQSFPVERMRFLARTLLTATFMVEGVLFALSLNQIQFRQNLMAGVAIVFAVIAIAYPLRTAVNIIRDVLPEYQYRAEIWDMRNAFIARRISEGERNLFIPGFGGVNGVKEIDNNPAHWINGCAAQFYSVDSIQAVSVGDDYLLEALGE